MFSAVFISSKSDGARFSSFSILMHAAFDSDKRSLSNVSCQSIAFAFIDHASAFLRSISRAMEAYFSASALLPGFLSGSGQGEISIDIFSAVCFHCAFDLDNTFDHHFLCGFKRIFHSTALTDEKVSILDISVLPQSSHCSAFISIAPFHTPCCSFPVLVSALSQKRLPCKGDIRCRLYRTVFLLVGRLL